MSSRWLDRLLWALLFVFGAVYLALGVLFFAERWLGKKLPEFVPQIEQRLAQRTALQWQLQDLSLDWRYLNPVLRIGSLHAHEKNDKGEQAVLTLNGAELYVDLASSVFSGELRLHGLRAEKIEALLSNAAGHWSLRGLLDKGRAGHTHWDRFVSHLKYIDIADAAFGFDRANTNNKQSDKPLRSYGDAIASFNGITGLSLRYYRNSVTQQFELLQTDHAVVESDLKPLTLRWERRKTEAEPEPVYAAYGQSVAHGGMGEWLKALFPTVARSDINAKFWVSKQPDSKARAVLQIETAAVDQYAKSAQAIDDNAKFSRFSLNSFYLEAYQHAKRKYAIVWQPAKLMLDDRAVQLASGSALFDSAAATTAVSVAVERIDLAEMSMALRRNPLLSPRSRNLLAALNPRGEIENFQLAVDWAKKSGLAGSGVLKNVSVSAWHGAPGGTGVDGTLEFSAKGGSVNIDDSDGLSIEFPKLYPAPHELAQVFGSVSWEIGLDRFFVRGRGLKANPVDHNHALVTGRFDVNGKISGDDASLMTLELGVADGNATQLLSLVPTVVPDSLDSWLAQATPTGHVKTGGFLYRGSLRADEAELRTIQLFVDVEQASFAYLPEWPKLTDIVMSLQISDTQSLGKIASARYRSIELSDGAVLLNTSSENQSVLVTAQLAGDVGGGLHFLQHAPLGETLQSTIGSWHASGRLNDGLLKVVSPLSNLNRDSVKVELTVPFSGVQLDMENVDLALSDLSGEIRYDSESGLSSDTIKADLWNRPAEIRLGHYPEGETPNPARLIVDAKAKASAMDLSNWLDLPLLRFAAGDSDFKLQIDADDAQARMKLSSHLHGMAISAPPPLFKTGEQSRELSLDWHLDGPRQPMKITVGQEVGVNLVFEDFDFSGAAMQFNTAEKSDNKSTVILQNKVSTVRDGVFSISGELDYFNLDEWRNAITQYENYQQAAHPTTNDDRRISLVGENIVLRDALVFDYRVNPLIISFEESSDYLLIDVESALAGGQIGIPFVSAKQIDNVATDDQRDVLDNTMPVLPENFLQRERLIVDLDYLRLPSLALSSKKEVSVSGFEQSFLLPSALQSMAVEIDQLYISDKAYGRWHFALTVSDNTALMHDIKADVLSLSLQSDEDDGLLWAVSSQGQLSSSLNLRVESDDFGGFLQSIQGPEEELPMQSKKMNADLSLAWQGAPHQVSLDKLAGEVEFGFREGRFFQTSTSTTGILKLLGLVNFDTIVRRVQLDFSDVYKEGLTFDSIDGRLDISDHQVMFTELPIDLKGPSSRFSLSGDIDLNDSTIDAELVATLPVAGNLPWIAALAGGLPVAAGTFIVTKVFDKQFDRLSSAVYDIEGSLDDPQVNFSRLFDNQKSSSTNASANSDTE